MSKRNSRDERKLNKLRKALRKGRLPSFINLEQWLEDRGYADSKGQARKIILDERVVSESHPLGTQVIGEGEMKMRVYNPIVPAHLRDNIEIRTKKES